jgi:hypothetical protein
MTPAVHAVSPPIAIAVVAPVPAPPWRVWRRGTEVLWFMAFALAIPLGILAIGAPIALAVKLLSALAGWS